MKAVNKLHYRGQQLLVLKSIYSMFAWGEHKFEEAVSVNRRADFLDALQYNYSYSPLWLHVHAAYSYFPAPGHTTSIF